mmetsp:Transcript_80891/g.135294  ORF Transcript_80891/g.135294 Transcript_80891/m.135294 type:complete len:216 (-) Transcript_80891:97-744(-)
MGQMPYLKTHVHLSHSWQTEERGTKGASILSVSLCSPTHIRFYHLPNPTHWIYIASGARSRGNGAATQKKAFDLHVPISRIFVLPVGFLMFGRGWWGHQVLVEGCKIFARFALNSSLPFTNLSLCICWCNGNEYCSCCLWFVVHQTRGTKLISSFVAYSVGMTKIIVMPHAYCVTSPQMCSWNSHRLWMSPGTGRQISGKLCPQMSRMSLVGCWP